MKAVTTDWARDVVERTIAALEPHTDPERAAGAFAYMKGVAPFIGISAPDRRKFLRAAWATLHDPTSNQLGRAALALMQLPQREYHYAAYDLIERYIKLADAKFLPAFGEKLLTTTSWWDSVDGLVTEMVSPLCRRYDHDDLIDDWSAAHNIWLIRAAIGHQRGWKRDTDIGRVLELCDRHWAAKEFFIAKAIGWALRDLARIEPSAVRLFLAAHPSTNRVAIREAERGLASR